MNQWRALRAELGSGKHDERAPASRRGSFETRKTSSVGEETSIVGERAGQKLVRRKEVPRPPEKGTPELPAPHRLATGPEATKANEANDTDAELGESFQQDSAAMLEGSAGEDQVMEKAIRAVVMGLQKSSSEHTDPEALEKVIKASVAEAARARKSGAAGQSNRPVNEVLHDDRELE